MANEVAVLMVETQLPIMMQVANALAVPKGSILNLDSGLTVTIADTNEDVFAGIAAEEKIANDGKTQIAVYRDGIFKCVAGAGDVTIGLPVGIVALNAFTDFATLDDEKGAIFGVALETAADTEFFLLDLGRNT